MQIGVRYSQKRTWSLLTHGDYAGDSQALSIKLLAAALFDFDANRYIDYPSAIELVKAMTIEGARQLFLDLNMEIEFVNNAANHH